MRILVLGAGALGGYFGARLLAAGRDVTFLVRPARALALREHGLRIVSPSNGDLHLRHVPTLVEEELPAQRTPFDLILLSCKAYDLASATDAVAPAVGPATAILPMLNGMAHLATLDARFGADRVLGGTCFISAALTPDGTIEHLNAREGLFFGERTPNPNMPAIAAALLDAGFSGAHRTDIVQDMWEKWTFLASLAGITCLLRAPVGTVAAAGAAPLALALFEECIAVAAASEHRPSDSFIALHQDFLTRPGSTLHASMLRDLQAGGPIEAQQIVGDLLDRAHGFNLATPLLEIAHAHLRCYEITREAPAA